MLPASSGVKIKPTKNQHETVPLYSGFLISLQLDFCFLEYNTFWSASEEHVACIFKGED
jgi:hypothetical protein